MVYKSGTTRIQLTIDILPGSTNFAGPDLRVELDWTVTKLRPVSSWNVEEEPEPKPDPWPMGMASGPLRMGFMFSPFLNMEQNLERVSTRFNKGAHEILQEAIDAAMAEPKEDSQK